MRTEDDLKKIWETYGAIFKKAFEGKEKSTLNSTYVESNELLSILKSYKTISFVGGDIKLVPTEFWIYKELKSGLDRSEDSYATFQEAQRYNTYGGYVQGTFKKYNEINDLYNFILDLKYNFQKANVFKNFDQIFSWIDANKNWIFKYSSNAYGSLDIQKNLVN
jgi:hypothetical protein